MMRQMVVLAIALAAAVPAFGQAMVTCESTDDRYRECDIMGPGRVILSRQISDRDCIEGKSWGVTRDGKVWVNNGCRGEFVLAERGFVNRNVSNLPGNVVVCESLDGNRTRCSVDTRGGVTLLRRLSDSRCVEGSTWGYTSNHVWVDSGCRAEFQVGAPPRAVPVSSTTRMGINDLYMTCQSFDGKRQYCPVDTRQGVRMVRKFSDASCDQNRDWGYDANGIWVDNGCRGEFAVTYDVIGLRVDPHTYSRFVCESHNNDRNYCRVNTGLGVQLATQLSNNDCTFGQTWGYDRDGIWVTSGCRGVFTVVSGGRTVPAMMSSSMAERVVCESENNGRKSCPAETRYGVMLLRQLSSSSCEFRRDWGFNEDGIWVNNGCRAEFLLDNDR